MMLSLADMSNPIVKASDYQSTIKFNDQYQIFWTIHNTTINGSRVIEFGCFGTGKGWLAIGFNPNVGLGSAMHDLDIYMGVPRNDSSNGMRVVDRWTTKKEVPKDDEVLGGKNSILQSNGQLVGGVIHFKFSRLMDTGDALDQALTSNSTFIVLAYSVALPEVRKHTGYFFARSVNLFDPQSRIPVFTMFPFHYIVLGLYLLAIITLALVQRFSFATFLKRSWCAPSGNKVIYYLTGWMTNVTFSEHLLIFGFIIVNISWGVVAFFDAYIPLTGKDVLTPMDIVEMIVKIAGHLSILSFTFILFPIVKNSFSLFLFGVTFEKAVKMHRWLARYLYLIISMHGIGYIVMTIIRKEYWAVFSVDVKANQHGFVFAGVVSWIILSIMIVFTFDSIRALGWEIFSLSHYLVYPAMAMAAVHDYHVAIHLFPGFMLHLIDWIIRYVRLTLPSQLVSARIVGGVTELKIMKPSLSFTAGQYAYLWIPSVSLFQMHPFSFSSNPHSEIITFHIKSMGKRTWTRNLHDIVAKNQGDIETIKLHGPYGNIPLHESVVILICGGIGVTPFLSILSDLYRKKGKVVYFNWVVKSASELSIANDLLSSVIESGDTNFIISLHVTCKSSDKSTLINQKHDFSELAFEQGRPLYDLYLKKIRNMHPSDCVGVYACGPQSLVIEAHQQARLQGFNINSEEFEY